jgi:hypothetical protein
LTPADGVQDVKTAVRMMAKPRVSAFFMVEPPRVSVILYVFFPLGFLPKNISSLAVPEQSPRGGGRKAVLTR